MARPTASKVRSAHPFKRQLLACSSLVCAAVLSDDEREAALGAPSEQKLAELIKAAGGDETKGKAEFRKLMSNPTTKAEYDKQDGEWYAVWKRVRHRAAASARPLPTTARAHPANRWRTGSRWSQPHPGQDRQAAGGTCRRHRWEWPAADG